MFGGRGDVQYEGCDALRRYRKVPNLSPRGLTFGTGGKGLHLAPGGLRFGTGVKAGPNVSPRGLRFGTLR